MRSMGSVAGGRLRLDGRVRRCRRCGDAQNRQYLTGSNIASWFYVMRTPRMTNMYKLYKWLVLHVYADWGCTFIYSCVIRCTPSPILIILRLLSRVSITWRLFKLSPPSWDFNPAYATQPNRFKIRTTISMCLDIYLRVAFRGRNVRQGSSRRKWTYTHGITTT